MVRVNNEGSSGRILCAIGEMLEQAFEIEIEVVCDATPADFIPWVFDNGRRWRPLIVAFLIHHSWPQSVGPNIASASTSPSGAKAAVS